MHNYLPSLKQMQYLVALHEHGHFGRAADACNVTQSTLSAGIRELETLLGQKLVERTRRVERLAEQRLELADRSEAPTPELQSLMRIQYAVFGLHKKQQHNTPKD